MLARTPATRLRSTAEPVKRINRDRQKAIRDKVAAIMRAVEPTPFAAEGPCRAGIRSALCLQGWRWPDADAAAAEIVAAALHIVGAKRPTWYQGQPEWTQPGALPVLRDRCKRCRGPIPEGRRMFCCFECKKWHHTERYQQARSEYIQAYHKARYAAKMRRAK